MRTIWLVLSSGLLALTITACAGDPACPPGKRKVGTRCQPLVEDPSSATEDDAGPGSDDASGILDCEPELETCDDGLDNDCDGEVDEGEPEHCNGVDDDCDGELDEGVLRSFYTDADGDGFGTGEALFACVAPAGFAPEASDCDDRHADASPAADEICDGVDNNCSGRPDDAFACVRGEMTECATRCGSTGVGTCTDGCTTPTGSACALPEEACNLIDDDCDGLVDEDLIASTARTHIWATSRTPVQGATSVARTGGGAWVLLNGPDGAGIQARELDEHGALIGTPSHVSQQTAGYGYFVADGDGRWIVIAGVESSSSQVVTRVRLFDAADFKFVGDHAVETGGLPYDVSILEDAQGAVRILLVVPSSGNGTRAYVISRSASGNWSSGSPLKVSDHVTLAMDMAVERIPCRDEWLLASGARLETQGGPYNGQARRITASGQFVGSSLILENAYGIGGLGRGPIHCEIEDPDMLVVVLRPPANGSTPSYATRLRVQRETGNLLRQFQTWSLADQFGNVSVAWWGGRWFLAGMQFGEETTSHLAELETTGSDVRWIDLGIASGPNPGGGHPLVFPSTGLVHTSEVLAATFVRGHGSNLDDIYHQQHPDDSLQANGVTYLVGCP